MAHLTVVTGLRTARDGKEPERKMLIPGQANTIARTLFRRANRPSYSSYRRQKIKQRLARIESESSSSRMMFSRVATDWGLQGDIRRDTAVHVSNSTQFS